MDILALLLMGLVFVASLVIQGGLQATFARFSRVANSRGLTGAEVARAILDAHGLTHVRVEPVPGALTDHYDPHAKAVRLSEPNYASPSLAALAVAAHEVGHAVQDAHGYTWLRVRASLWPAASLGTNLGPILVVGGLMLGAIGLAKLGLYLYLAVALFQLVTLPVEFDASRRALEFLRRMGFLSREEMAPAQKVLTWAALTYVAALASSLAAILYYASLLMGRREE
ncbi:Zn-dependent protease [Thermus scotoductus]|uniref:Zn-dependent protease n=1 Tax=Thermus scotoductus TaxID=37636 RepID=A0A430SAG2_THESC|nr:MULTISPECIES: zinc metallopeptidase [Thermus]RTH32946.1 Zn-dependent protease [Thermus scotoductus]RTI04615.1 Zn-dependent protease [Thermus scotoductus]ULR39863.1 zinc metallopeptidase [Thermus sp. NEB1569]